MSPDTASPGNGFLLFFRVDLDHLFDWFDARYEAHRIWFGREEYGGERDILPFPCELVSFDHRRSFLWTPDECGKESTGSVGRRDGYRRQSEKSFRATIRATRRSV
jgi:hypothetical protein